MFWQARGMLDPLYRKTLELIIFWAVKNAISNVYTSHLANKKKDGLIP